MLPGLVCLILLQEEGSLATGKVALQLVGFLPFFAIYGALGFYLLVLRRTAGLPPEAEAFVAAARRASRIGFAGAVLLLVMTFRAMSNGRSGPQITTQIVCGVLLCAAFALWRLRGAWALGALVAVALALRNIGTGRWTSLVNPLHVTAASLWIGSLFFLVAVGLPAVLRGSVPPERREGLVAEMVSRFSSLALGAAALLGVTGVITAWRHLKFLAALWTTPYGYAFDVKLCLVLIVAAIGGWNWRRMRPRLGAEGTAYALQRSATRELLVAALVLMVTAVLVSLPTPQLPTP
jgi:putative copper export protein